MRLLQAFSPTLAGRKAIRTAMFTIRGSRRVKEVIRKIKEVNEEEVGNE
jgi:hypothetical protein